MKSKFTIASLLILAIFMTITSCTKSSTVSEKTNVSNRSPLELIATLGDVESDFSIKVSTSKGHSLFGSNPLGKATVFIEAASKTETNVGDLTVEQQNIPFNSKSYFYQLNLTQSSLSFTGKNNITVFYFV